MYGSKYLDTKIIKGKEGILLDSESNEELVVNAPKAVLFYVTIKGVASHAGVAPEKGISAIQVAAKAISMMRLGRIDPMTILKRQACVLLRFARFLFFYIKRIERNV